MEENKKARGRKLLKVPTVEDFESYRGGHTFKKWQALPKNWRCPGWGAFAIRVAHVDTINHRIWRATRSIPMAIWHEPR